MNSPRPFENCPGCGSWQLTSNGQTSYCDWQGRYTRYMRCRVCAIRFPVQKSRLFDVVQAKRDIKGRQVVIVSPGADWEQVLDYTDESSYVLVAVNDGFQPACKALSSSRRTLDYVVTADQLWAKRYHASGDVSRAVCLATRPMRVPNREPWRASQVFASMTDPELYHGNESGAAAMSFAYRLQPERGPVLVGFTKPIEPKKWANLAHTLRDTGYPSPQWEDCHTALEGMTWL